MSHYILIPLAIFFLVFLDDVLLSIDKRNLKLYSKLFMAASYVDIQESSPHCIYLFVDYQL
jgi:hypothetical protein